MHQHQDTRQLRLVAAGLLLSLGLLGGVGVSAVGAEPPGEIKQAFELTSQGYRLFRSGQLEEAETRLQEALVKLPSWWGPSAVLGALYQQRAAAARQAGDRAAAAALESKARAAYQVVYEAAFQATFSKPPALPWLEAEQVVTPTRGLLGSSPPDLFRLLLLAADTLPETTAALPLIITPEPPRPAAPEDCQALVNFSVGLLWSLNEARLAEQTALLCPDAWLTLLARAYGAWLLQSGTRGQKWREERFARLFPEVATRLTTKEVLAWAEPQRGQLRPGLPVAAMVQESLARLLRATTHRQVLLDGGLEWLGCAVVPAGQNAYILQFDLATQRR